VVVLLTEFTLTSLIPIRSKNLCSTRDHVAKLFIRRKFLTSACKAYNEFLGTLQYYYNIVMPKKRVKAIQQENKWVTAGINSGF
jgi:hypothetical protein